MSLFFASISGCGDSLPKRVPVSGRVLIDGKPLEYGVVQVFPKGERSAYGTLGPGGKFALTTFTENDGCMLGKHPVAVNAAKGISSTKMQWFAPKKYANVATSGLEIDVPGPRNEVEINLKWDGEKPYIETIGKK
ncbi:MAG: hypothetical protein ABSA77_11270 [Thermoguttaceae bacterium]